MSQYINPTAAIDSTSTSQAIAKIGSPASGGADALPKMSVLEYPRQLHLNLVARDGIA
jgi:hypothetical protein